MTTKEIIIKNIGECGFTTGNSVRGKGLEILTSAKTLSNVYAFGAEVITAEKAQKALAKISGNVTLKLRLTSEDTAVEVSEEFFRANIIGARDAFVIQNSELLGYVSVSKYDADLV